MCYITLLEENLHMKQTQTQEPRVTQQNETTPQSSTEQIIDVDDILQRKIIKIGEAVGATLGAIMLGMMALNDGALYMSQEQIDALQPLCKKLDMLHTQISDLFIAELCASHKAKGLFW